MDELVEAVALRLRECRQGAQRNDVVDELVKAVVRLCAFANAGTERSEVTS
jgi:hypothetical protein